MVTVQKLVQAELDRLLDVLPQRVSDKLRQREDLEDLLEVILDLGRVPEARFTSGDVVLDEQETTREELDYLVEWVGDFGDDNRAGIERTLHRISAIRNRKGQVACNKAIKLTIGDFKQCTNTRACRILAHTLNALSD